MINNFSNKVKKEISAITANQDIIIEVTTLLVLNAKFINLISDEKNNILINTDNKLLINKIYNLIYTGFGITVDISCIRKSKNYTYTIFIPPSKNSLKIIQGMKYSVDNISSKLFTNIDSYKSLIRACFLSNGYINDPNKSYHLEFLLTNELIATQLIEALEKFDIKISKSYIKNSIKLYLKDSDSISTFLSVIGANLSVFDFENIRVIKNIRNNVNRKVNFETANIGRIASASKSKVDDIKFIMNTIGLDKLDKQLQEIAILRLKYENASLQELAKYCSDNISKSGINHRLKKISDIASDLRYRRNYAE